MAENGHMTLSQLQARIKDVLAEGFRVPVWVVAEIAEMKVNYSSGHCYLELVEKGSANGVPKAQARAVVWRTTYGMLSAYFKGATGQELAAGMKVLVSVSVTYHELYGLSLQVTDIDPLYTMGDMEKQRQQTIVQLKEDGVFDLNRELDFPVVVQRIAVISSPGAAGFRDFMMELDAYAYRFDVRLFGAVMQGHGAEESIIGALESIAAEADEFDALVIIRGGGSQSDLSFLNSYMLSFHIAQFPLPVITGLGHDKDQSVIDMVAALSLKTPTAVAGHLVGLAAGFDKRLEECRQAIWLAIRQYFASQDRHIASLAGALSRQSSGMTHDLELRLERAENELTRRKEQFFITRSNHLAALCTLLTERTKNTLRSETARLGNMDNVIAARDPQAILSMGFAIVRSSGKALHDASQVTPGETVEITLKKGKIKAKITGNGNGN